jgi:hypothetical protein
MLHGHRIAVGPLHSQRYVHFPDRGTTQSRRRGGDSGVADLATCCGKGGRSRERRETETPMRRPKEDGLSVGEVRGDATENASMESWIAVGRRSSSGLGRWRLGIGLFEHCSTRAGNLGHKERPIAKKLKPGCTDPSPIPALLWFWFCCYQRLIQERGEANLSAGVVTAYSKLAEMTRVSDPIRSLNSTRSLSQRV